MKPAPLIILLLVAISMVIPSGLVPSAALAQSAKDEGKKLGNDLKAKLEQDATTPVTGSSVPGFTTADPVEATYYSNPDAISGDGFSASYSDKGALTVRESLALRPIIEPAALDAFLGLGFAAQNDAQAYVSGFTGQYGDCAPLAVGDGPATYYLRTCNTGVIPSLELVTCTVPLNHITNDYYIYVCDASAPDLCPSSIDALDYGCDGPYRVCFEQFGTGCIDIWVCSQAYPGIPEQTVYRVYDHSEKDLSLCDALIADRSCTLTSEACTDAEPKTRQIDGVLNQDGTADITLDCWQYQRTYECNTFTPASDCADVESDPNCTFESETCLSFDDTGTCTATEKVYRCPVAGSSQPITQITCGEDIYCLDGSCDSVTREANTSFPDAATALQLMASAPGEFDPDNLTIFKGEHLTCPKALFGTINCCTDDGLLIDIGLASCSGEAIALAEKKAAGLCRYVGTYCSSKFLGVCTKKRKSYCCYKGKLTRILIEEAHIQLSLSWGTAEIPDCSGLTIDQFQALDFSIMDFSEFYADAQATTDIPAEADVLQMIQSKIEAYYAN